MSPEPRVAPWYRRIPWHVLAFMAPAVMIYTVFMIYPLFESLRLSLLDENGLFTGLDNYVRLLTDQNWAPRFFGAVSNNIVFFIIHMIAQNGVGLLFAAIPHHQGVARSHVLPHRDPPADRAVGGDHRLRLAAHPEPAVRHR